MSAGFFKRENEIDKLMRASRPRVSQGLADGLIARASAAARAPRRMASRLTLAGAVTALMVVALASVGGIGYAASTISDVVKQVTGPKVFMGSRMAVSVKSSAASTDQYGNPTNSQNTATQPAALGTTGSATVTAPPPSGSTTPTVVTVTWSAGTFAQAVTVHIDPTPPAVQNTTFLGSNNQVIAINVTDSSGKPVHSLAAPLDVVFKNPPAGFVPVVSEDGVTFRALKEVSGPTADLGTSGDGYYVDSSGNIHVLTLHLTVFAVLYKGNVGVSESGRKLAKPGSGLFGDPTLIHPGKATLKQVGRTVSVYPLVRQSGRAVAFSFFVDEQVAAYVSVYQGSTPLPISTNGTMIRGKTLTRPGIEKTLHFPILKPGTYPIRLRIPGNYLKPGVHYRIRVSLLDFDGHRTQAYIPFTEGK